ncbi:DUF2271 domain-containing protein [Sediminibacterium ginsengisoli]|uniref:FAD:protein FMN transferase n=1 Tax=Sediminibacterium ginsengisoli TaxID=413434 RepID=A0A1T4RUW2_9BACT|nr:DUF2271 domain-containing protein [Sediminibacterium ginsengisoli]SKA19381.1 Thiamine biosynthesis lipoprotein ApbE [Sediminibacterium ginsengisoli]
MKFFPGRLAAMFTLALFTTLVQATPPSTKLFASHFDNVLGTSLDLKIAAPTEAAADKAEAAVMKEISRMASILSAYDANSEFSKWLRTYNEPVKVSAELFEVLSLFDQWRQRSTGALNASAEVVNRLWKQAATQQRLPSTRELAVAVEAAGSQHWKLDAANQTATHLSKTPLALNSFAKSYIINRAADAALNAAGTSAVVVNIGGDIVVRGSLTETVSVTDPKADTENDDPVASLLISNKAVATSGNYRRGVQIGNNWYSHIVDPRSGQPAGNIISATVVASNATDAGALATAFNVLTPEESKALAAGLPDVEYLLITKDGERIESAGWNALETGREHITVTAPPAANQWDTNYELIVNLEVSVIEGRARRPFIAVWIEDSNNKPVRNLVVWYNRDRWLPDLKTWYRHYGQSIGVEGSIIGSTSSATRPPGKYALKWDGKDDKGNLVKPGKYSVHIEAAREHGTYQVMTEEMEFNSKPKQITLTGNVEIASASLDYRKKPSGK